MEYRQLGNTGMQVAPLTLGGNILAGLLRKQLLLKYLMALVVQGLTWLTQQMFTPAGSPVIVAENRRPLLATG